MSSSTNPNELYQLASRQSPSQIDFWGNVPSSFSDAVDLAIENFTPNQYKGTEKIQKLKKILREYHKELGILTPKVETHLELLDQGSVLMGQQPIVFGGPGFIGNKIGCLLLLDELLEVQDLKLAPVFFIGDYDGLQKELARQYFPNPISQNAIILDSEDYLPEESNIAAHAADLPPLDWIDRYLDKIEENLNGFKSQVKGPKKILLDERWYHIRTILKSSFMKANTLSDWGAMIWGYITNIVADYGVIFLPTSHPKIRELIGREYHRYIENRSLYAGEFQKATDQIVEMGYQPTLPHRHDDYAPFTLECEDDNNRITTSIIEKDGHLFAEGECPSCKKYKSYEVTEASDLDKIATIIGPRVDTSQAVFQDIMNIRIRISGPGEIAYYAQAAPAVRAIGFDLPIFVKYKRAFYNSTWNEKIGKLLESRNQGTLHQKQLFNILRKRMDALKENDTEGVIDAEAEMEEFIVGQYESLLNGKDSNDVRKYLGWQFGRFEDDKYPQETSWVWFDMALQTGVSDYIETYHRMYTPVSGLGGMFFVNSQI